MNRDEKNIMYNFSSEDHRKRLNNIRFIEKTNGGFAAKNLISDYIQGQFVWPRTRFNPQGDDEEIMEMLSKNGVELVQLWEKLSQKDHKEGEHPDLWDMHLGNEMYRPYDSQACKDFINLAHKYGIKVIPYTSTNFYRLTASDFDPSWALPRDADLCGVLAHCSPASPKWRERIIRQYANILDEYEFDGIYIDSGYRRPSDYIRIERHYMTEFKVAEDEIIAFEESACYDGAMEDMLGLIYGEVKKRGGILKLHQEGADVIHSRTRVYDYLWVGECIEDLDFMREKTKSYQPYVVPDCNFELADEDERFLHSIPYMQFPVMRTNTMGVGAYDAKAGDFERHIKWLDLYQRLTTVGTWCYMDINMPEIICSKGKNTVTTVYVNKDIYVVAANYGYTDDTLKLAGAVTEFTPEGEGARIENSITVPARKMKIFRFDGDTDVCINRRQRSDIEQSLIATD